MISQTHVARRNTVNCAKFERWIVEETNDENDRKTTQKKLEQTM